MHARALTAAALAAYAGAAQAADIVAAGYDPRGDALVVEIAYRGTSRDHDFRLEWGKCERTGEGPRSIPARVVDQQGGELARENFRARERFSLAGLECRPALVTLRLGRASIATVAVPAAP